MMIVKMHTLAQAEKGQTSLATWARQTLPIDANDAILAGGLPWEHRDPSTASWSLRPPR